MKVKTSELIGAALDWSVAQAAEQEIHHEYVDDEQRKMLILKWQDYSRNEDFHQQKEWSPSTDWSQGGPLIEKYRVGFSVYSDQYSETHFASIGYPAQGSGSGQTHLVAAMRAIVAAKLGDEVDVPEGLV